MRHKPTRIAGLKPPSAPVALQRDTEMVRSDLHSEFSSQVRKNIAGGGTFAMCLYRAQSGIAQRYALGRLSDAGSAARGSGHRRGSRGPSSSTSLRRHSLPEPVQHTLGYFQLTELST